MNITISLIKKLICVTNILVNAKKTLWKDVQQTSLEITPGNGK